MGQESPQITPIHDILAGKYTDQIVTVQGRTGHIVREESTATTVVYTLRDDYGDVILIRSGQRGNLHMGTTYHVKGKRFPLVKTTTTLGRMEDRDIQLTDITVSCRHCVLEFRGGKFFLRNESAQGTRVSGELIQQERELQDGDEIEMGGTVIKFVTLRSSTSSE